MVSISHTANPEDKATQEVAAPEPAAAVQEPEAAEVTPASQPSMVILDDALPEGAITQGKWEWSETPKYSGSKSHTEPAAEGLTEHSYIAAPVSVPERNVIEQYIYLDPDKTPEGIELRFRFESEGGEGEIGVYREGEREVFVFNDDEAVIYDGTLPEPGKWVKWEIDPDDLGLKDAKITGVSFVVYGGKANWDLLQFVPSKKYSNNSQPYQAGN